MTAAENVIPLRHPTGPVSVPGSPGWTYETAPKPGIRRESTVGKGDERSIVVTDVLDWCPVVSARLVSLRDDGTVAGTYYRITVGEDTGVFSLPQVTSGELWERLPDAYGIGTKTVRDILTSVITGQAHRLPRTMAVTRTGWHATPDGGRMYVYPDGRTWPAGAAVELVGMPERLSLAAVAVPACDDATVREGLAAMVEHGGWAPLVGLAAGARSLGQSIRPVPAALVLWGDPNSGKTSAATAGRMLMLAPTWPPVATARMSDTPADLEASVDTEADMPTLLDDLALTGTSSALDQRKAVEQVERIIRPLGNGEAIRGRRTRDMTAQARRYVRSIAVLTAQQLPTTMQASLYRRAVVLHLTPGDTNITWWMPKDEGGQGGADRVGPVLRTIADRIIARLGAAEDPRAVLAEADQTAMAALLPAVDAAVPGWLDSTDGMAGVVQAAGKMLAGLVLVAEAAGVEPGPLLAAVVDPMARCLADQAYTLDDRRRAADDLPSAVGDILRAALTGRRAHVRDHGGDLRPENGPPGLTSQEMGLRECGRDMAGLPTWEGYGPPLYWLPSIGEAGAVGVGRAALHDLVRASGDPRASGKTPGSLVADLGRVGALLPSPERGRAWSVNHRLTGASGSTRMIWLRPDVVWPDMAEQAPPADGDAAPGPADTPPAGDHPVTPSEPPADRETTPAPAATCDTESAPVTVPEATRPALPTGPALALGCDSDVIYLGDGRDREPAGAYDSMAALLSLVVDLMPEGGTVALSAEVAAAVGYPERAENARPGKQSGKQLPAEKSRQECRAVADARAAGWESSAAGIGAWTVWHGPDRPSVAVVVLPWLDYKRMRVTGAPFLRSTDGPLEAAYMLARYRQDTGVPYVMTSGTSGTNMIRAHYTGRPATPGRRRPRTPRLKWDGAGSPAETDQEVACRWGRALTDDERAMPYVIQWDSWKAYLGAEAAATLAVDALAETGLPADGFRSDLPGYWQVSGQWAPYDLLPALTGRGESTGPHWLTTPTVELLLQHGMPEAAITNAWLPANGRGSRILRPIAERLRDGIAAIPADCQDPEEARVRDALKATYTELYGMLARGTKWVQRRDWSDTVIATNRANLLRKAIQIGKATDRWPIEIDYDALYYACASPDADAENPAPDILKTGETPRLGMFVVKGVYPMSDFLSRKDVRCHA